MAHILSIQSHVASGYVGNRSAVFPLQRLGCEVSFVNTVQFSNHTGYGTWTGEIFSAEHIQDIIDGLWKNHTLDNIDAILSGYQGAPELGQVIAKTVREVKEKYPDVIYCCDPVIGDDGRGVYVLPETAEFIKNESIKLADIITPNQFELSFLSGQKIHTLGDVLSACATLHAQGPKIILVTSLIREDAQPHTIEMLVSTAQGIWICCTPRFEFDKAPNGSGDATAAIFLAQYLKHHDVKRALEHSTAALYAIFKHTHSQDKYELQFIAAQDEIVNPSETFPAIQL